MGLFEIDDEPEWGEDEENPEEEPDAETEEEEF